MEENRWGKTKTLLLLAALTLTFYITYKVHLTRPYPLHVDEWQHMAMARCTIEGGRICSVNPYFSDEPALLNLEGGFHAMVSMLSIVGGTDLVRNHRFMPALFACISAAILFAAVRRRNTFLAAFFSAVFMASVRSNINVLGFMFFTPLTLAIPLIYALFLTVPEAVAKARDGFLIASTAVWGGIALIHPPSALILVPATVLYGVLEWRNVFLHWRFYLKSGAVILLVSSLIFLAAWEYRIKPTYVQSYGIKNADDFTLLSKLVSFGKKVRHVDIDYDLIDFYGRTQAVLALLGLAIAIRRREWFTALWPATMLVWLEVTAASDTQVLVYYQRMFYYALISLVPLAGIGAGTLVGFFDTTLRSDRFKAGAKRGLLLLVVAVAVGYIISSSFENYFVMHPKAPLYNIMDESEYLILSKLEQNHGEGNVVYADKWTSVIVYPVTGNKVVHMVTANLWGRDENDLDNAFSKMTCDEKKDFTRRYKVDFMLTRSRLNCTFLKLEGEEGGDYLYKVNP
jgi:hypothetical protein